MAITNLDQLADAMANRSQQLVVNKGALTGQTVGGFASMWTSAGTPGAGSVPTAAAICTNALTGSFGIVNASGGRNNYLGRAMLLPSVAATDVQFHDRLAHMGGLSGVSTTAQTIGLDASNAALDGRRGSADFGDVQWWVEHYTATGSTGRTLTLTGTYDDNSPFSNVTVSIPASQSAGRMLAILPATAGRRIKTITSGILNATTGTAGNFGITLTRALAGMSLGAASQGMVYTWEQLGLPIIADNACVFMVVMPGTTSTGTLYGSGKVVEG